MKQQPVCDCQKPILSERSEWKGLSQSECARCKRPIGFRTAVVRTAT